MGLVGLHKELYRAFPNLERWHVRQKIVSDKEAHEHCSPQPSALFPRDHHASTPEHVLSLFALTATKTESVIKKEHGELHGDSKTVLPGQSQTIQEQHT
jgi:hypothetical protein